MPRYLCSQLVKLCCDGAALTVNLEEIWETGAVLECDEDVDTNRPVDLHCGSALFCGQLTKGEKHPFGWRFEMMFSALTPWSPDRFRPAHFLDPSELGPD